MKELFDELGLSKNVTFTGGISEERKNELLGQSRIGLSLSFEEGWGLSINEFLGAGLPVVAYDLPIYAHVFANQLDLASRGDQSGVAEKILSWLEDEARQMQRGRGGREFVRRYDFREVAVRELEALTSLFPKQ